MNGSVIIAMTVFPFGITDHCDALNNIMLEFLNGTKVADVVVLAPSFELIKKDNDGSAWAYTQVSIDPYPYG
ncbi:MAG: hypothetical protein AcusKO_42540 [Acuticoccus sp.]